MGRKTNVGENGTDICKTLAKIDGIEVCCIIIFNMPASHSLVLHSLVYSLILCLIFLFYMFAYPKKRIPPLIALLLISSLPLISILRPGPYESGDLSIHIMEVIAFTKYLSQGDFFPIWGGDMNATYGYPSFLFTYPLPFYLMSFIHLFGFSYIASAKLFLISAYILSGVFMYMWLKKEFGERSAFIGALVYLFAPYHLIDLHFRVDVGEVLAFMFLPLSLLLAKKYIETNSITWFILQIISLVSLILSHPAISILGFPLIFIYTFYLIWIKKKVNRLSLYFKGMSAFLLAILLSAFYWIPVVTEIKYTQHILNTSNIALLQFSDLLYSPWRFGLLFQGPMGQLAMLIGYAQILILLVATFYLIKNIFNINDRKIVLFLFIILIILVFMMLEISRPLWYILPFIKNFQFAYRLHGVMMLIIAVIAAILVKYISSKWVYIFLCLFIVLSTILNWGNRKNLPNITDQVLTAQIPNTATNGAGINQAITYWSDPENPYAKTLPKSPSEIIQGQGEVKMIQRKNVYHLYEINAKTDVIVKENTLYFPGWNVYINNSKTNIDILNTSTPRGLISYAVPKGKHKVEVILEDTPIRSLSKSISFATVLFISLIVILNIYFRIFIFKK